MGEVRIFSLGPFKKRKERKSSEPPKEVLVSVRIREDVLRKLWEVANSSKGKTTEGGLIRQAIDEFLSKPK